MIRFLSFLIHFVMLGYVASAQATSIVAPPCGSAPLPVSSITTQTSAMPRLSASEEFMQAQLRNMETPPYHYDKRCFDEELVRNPAGNVKVLPALIQHFSRYLQMQSALPDEGSSEDVVRHSSEVAGSMLKLGKYGHGVMADLLMLSYDSKIKADLRISSLQAWIGFSAFAELDVMPVLNSFLQDAATPYKLRRFVVSQLKERGLRAKTALPALRQEIASLNAGNGARSDSRFDYDQVLIPTYAALESPEQAWENLLALYLKVGGGTLQDVLHVELRKSLANHPAFERKLVKAMLDSKDENTKTSLSHLANGLRDTSALSMLLVALNQPEQAGMVLDLLARQDENFPEVQNYLLAELSKPERALDIASMILRMGKPLPQAQAGLFSLWQGSRDPNAQRVYLSAMLKAGPVQPSMQLALLRQLRADIAYMKGQSNSQRLPEMGAACLVLEALVSLPAAQKDVYVIVQSATPLTRRHPYSGCVQEFATAIAARQDKQAVDSLFRLLLDPQVNNKFPIKRELLALPELSVDALPNLLRTAHGVNLMWLEDVLAHITHPRASDLLTAHANRTVPGLQASLRRYIASGGRPKHGKGSTVEYNQTSFSAQAQIVWHLLQLSPNDPKTAALMLTQLGSDDELIVNLSSQFLDTYAAFFCSKANLASEKTVFLKALNDLPKRSFPEVAMQKMASGLMQKCAQDCIEVVVQDTEATRRECKQVHFK